MSQITASMVEWPSTSIQQCPQSVKCCCMVYHWTPDEFDILCPSQQIPEEVTIHLNSKQNDTCIPALVPSDGTCYLGLYITSNGSMKLMENHLWKKAILYTKAFQCTPMSHCKAGVLYRSCFLPALTYPLPMTWLPPAFLNWIH